MKKQHIIAMIMAAVMIVPMVSAVAVPATPNLSVGSCLMESTEEFHVKGVGKDAPAHWKLFKAGSSDYLDLGWIEVGETVYVTTPLEGTWVKKYFNPDTEQWVQRGGTHVTSIAGHTQHENFCEEPHDVPEFGVIAALGVLIVAGVFVARRRH